MTEKFIVYIQFWRYFQNYFTLFFYSHVYQKACKDLRKVLEEYVGQFLSYEFRVK